MAGPLASFGFRNYHVSPDKAVGGEGLKPTYHSHGPSADEKRLPSAGAASHNYMSAGASQGE